jgi:hypothetical protein
VIYRKKGKSKGLENRECISHVRGIQKVWELKDTGFPEIHHKTKRGK